MRQYGRSLPKANILSVIDIIYNMAKRSPVAGFDRGDYVKVEFESEVQGLPGEWMWVRVHHCDEERQVVFGTLDNEPVVNLEDLQLGEEVAINYGKVCEHKKPWEFRKN